MTKVTMHTWSDPRDNSVSVLLDDVIIRLDREGARFLAEDLAEAANELDHSYTEKSKPYTPEPPRGEPL